MEIRIFHLHESPEHRPMVARWIYDEFWADKDLHTPESLEGLLEHATEPHGIPASLLAMADDVPAGTVNLVENDDDNRLHLRPWLAALFVVPRFRGRGIGSLLIGTLRDYARRNGEGGMYLGTDNPNYYAKRGATVVERLGSGFCVMFLSTADKGADEGADEG